MATSTILFCWEYGGGLGHISSLHIVAESLKKLDVKCRLVNPGGIQFPGKFHAFDEVIEFPSAYGLQSLALSEDERIVSYNSNMKAFGFDNPKYIFTRLKLWQKVFEAYKPVLVIGDYAPMAILAATKLKIPTMATGNGYTLPPTNITTYPAFTNQVDPVSDQHILKCTNQALHLANMGQISTVPEIFKSDIHACFTNPILDPFKKVRKPTALGALLKSVSASKHDNPVDQIFIYLTNCNPSVVSLVLSAAMQTKLNTHVYTLQVNDGMRKIIKGSDVTILEEPLPLSKICRNYNMVMHLGGHNLMMEMLEAGMPQLLLPIDMEKILYAQGMENLGFAHQLRLDKPKSNSLLVAKIRETLADKEMKKKLGQYVCDRAKTNHDECLQTVGKSIQEILPH